MTLASNENLPRMLDEETRLDSASIDQSKKIYTLKMTLVNISQSEIDRESLNEVFTQTIKPGTCGSAEFRLFLSEGYTLNFAYYGRDDKEIKIYSLKLSDCE